MQGIKAVFFDVDNTLLDFRKCGAYAAENAFKDCGVNLGKGFIDVFFKINTGLWLDVEKKVITIEQLQKIRFNRVAQALGVVVDGIEAEKRFRHHLKQSHFVVDGAKEIVQYLSQKYPLYVASNSVSAQQNNRLEKAGLLKYFTKIFVSEDIGYSKPTKEFYQKCFESVENASPSQTVMIGDSLSADILGAYNFGMKSIWFNIENKPVPTDLVADCVVDNLLQIKNIL